MITFHLPSVIRQMAPLYKARKREALRQTCILCIFPPMGGRRIYRPVCLSVRACVTACAYRGRLSSYSGRCIVHCAGACCRTGRCSSRRWSTVSHIGLTKASISAWRQFAMSAPFSAAGQLSHSQVRTLLSIELISDGEVRIVSRSNSTCFVEIGRYKNIEISCSENWLDTYVPGVKRYDFCTKSKKH